jgi:flavin reductase (DIM6/NTAB) family NADH-FMN oxidoreductase RutF
MDHVSLEPAIHYWGTPVVLISTLNEDGTTNVAPMSSAWWLGWSCMLGLDASSQTASNLRRHPECVLNLADVALAEAVDRLALTTGAAEVPLHKKLLGYRSVADKFAHGILHPETSLAVRPQRVLECKVQLEAVVEGMRPFARSDPRMAIAATAIEVRIVRAHVAPSLLTNDRHIDPVRWRPLVMSFRRFFSLGDEVRPSRLARGPEEAYAPWKGGPVRALAGKALAAWSRRVHGVPEEP